jgi:hypothetical protein
MLSEDGFAVNRKRVQRLMRRMGIAARGPRIDRLLVDENCVDDTAHLDQLLPVSAVPGEARELTCAHRTDLAETNLGHHSLEAGALYAAGRRAAEIVDRSPRSP